MSQVREIAQLGAEVLRCKAKQVQDFQSAEIQELIGDMFATLANTNGVGLAAPQISVSLQMLIIASRPSERYPLAPNMEPVVMINPSFEPLSAIQVKDWEGCLSIPGIRALVPRYVSIRVNYTDTTGDLVSVELQDFVARIFQHEYDHLNGLVYLDRVETNRDIISSSEYDRVMSKTR